MFDKRVTHAGAACVLMWASMAHAQFSLDEVFKNLRSGSRPDAQDGQVFARYQSDKSPANLNQLAQLAAMEGHPRARNYMGCIYSNGIGVTPDPQKAWQYFRAASTLPIAQHNLAIIYSSRGDRAMAKTLFNNAWRGAGLEESGVWLMSILEKEGADNKEMAETLEMHGNYIASYYVARNFYLKGNLEQALTKADYSASRMFRPANLLLSDIYFKRARSATAADSESTVKEWVTQGFQYLFMADMIEKSPLPTLNQYKGKYDTDNDVVKSAYTKAYQLMRNMGPPDKSYLLPLCDPKKVIQHKDRQN